MSGLNKVILIGRLGRDPEYRETQSGKGVLNMTVATSENWVKDGVKEEKTEWHRIVIFGKLAETCRRFLSKGRQVYVEGKLQTREWNDKDGNRRFTTEVVANNVLFLDGKGQHEDVSSQDTSSEPAGHESPAPVQETFNRPENDADDDIPF